MLDKFSIKCYVYHRGVYVCFYLFNLFKTNWMVSVVFAIRITSHLVLLCIGITPSLVILTLVHILSYQFDKIANWHWHCSMLHVTTYHTEHICLSLHLCLCVWRIFADHLKSKQQQLKLKVWLNCIRTASFRFLSPFSFSLHGRVFLVQFKFKV